MNDEQCGLQRAKVTKTLMLRKKGDCTLEKMEKYEMLKSKLLQTVSPKFDTPEAMLDRFFANQAPWRIFLNSCMWAKAPQSLDEGKLRRNVQILEVQKLQNSLPNGAGANQRSRASSPRKLRLI